MTPSSVSTREQAVTSCPSVVFTGHSLRGRLIVLIGNQRVPLTIDQFELLAVFAKKRLNTSTGRVTVRDVCVSDLQHFRTKIFRLRHALDDALGPGFGELLIVNGVTGEYSLAVSPNAIFADVSCHELPCEFSSGDVTTFPPPPNAGGES